MEQGQTLRLDRKACGEAPGKRQRPSLGGSSRPVQTNTTTINGIFSVLTAIGKRGYTDRCGDAGMVLMQRRQGHHSSACNCRFDSCMPTFRPICGSIWSKTPSQNHMHNHTRNNARYRQPYFYHRTNQPQQPLRNDVFPKPPT